jgi:hypothetical protein
MTDRSPLRDDELVRLLARDPELLAVADALVATRERPTRARRRASVLAAAALAVAACALLLVSPWQGGDGFVSRALAAVGDDEVLHVLVSRPAPFGETLVDISSGQTIERASEQEIWFDATRGLEATVSTLDGEALDRTLRTPEGGWTQDGPIYTCAWIAAHPVAATKARVSCNASMENGTTPRHVPETPPTLDPALAGFVDRYRSALASGEATEVGTGELGGREVVWLEFAVPRREGSLTERVAVDASSYAPVRVEAVHQGGTAEAYDVLEIETLPYAASLFPMPEQRGVPAKAIQQSREKREVTPRQAAAALGGTAYWLGEHWQGLRLVATRQVEWAIGFGPRRPPTREQGIELVYAAVAADGTVAARPSLRIYESTSCVTALAWTCTPHDPDGEGRLAGGGFVGAVRLGDVYVSIFGRLGGDPSLLEVAQALRPLTA